MNLTLSYKFNCVIFIESLEERDQAKSTKSLFNDIVKRLCEKRKLLCKYHTVKNKKELLGLLKEISSTKSKNLFPLIHFATHGNEDEIRLIDERVTWSEIEPIISKINLNSRNNLILVMAVCKGIFAIDFLEKNLDRAPFNIIIGPQKDINYGLLDELLTYFYEDILDGRNIAQALKRMKEIHGKKIPLMPYSCMQFFQFAMESFEQDLNKGALRHDLIKLFKEIHGIDVPYEFREQIQNKKDLKNRIKDLRISQSIKNRYFMIDLYEENEERFKEINL